MDLPTYTNIWRIEKRLYKLYDFRLPMPLPINWIAVFAGITLPYVILLIAVGLPFNHTLVWLYVLPPGLITWLTTRPVIENKRLPELVESQVRYLAEPRTWVRFAPLTEKEQMVVTARVWHSRRPVAGQGAPTVQPVLADQEGSGAPAPPVAPQAQAQAAQPGKAQVARPGLASPAPVPAPLPAVRRPSTQRRAGEGLPARARGGTAAAARLEMSHDGPGRPPVMVVPPSPPAWPGPPANPVNAWPAPARPLRRITEEIRITPPTPPSEPALPSEPAPPSEPEVPAEPEPVAEPDSAEHGPDPESSPQAEPARQARLERAHEPGESAAGAEPAVLLASEVPDPPAPPAAVTAMVDETARRAVPSIERALSGPSRDRNLSWHGTVKIVTGAGASAAQGPGARDQEALDRNRARLTIDGPRRILILGCTTGAGQTVTALMAGYLLASLREQAVAAVDLHDGTLARYRAPAAWLEEILAGRPPQAVRPSRPDGLHPTPKANPARLDVIASHEPLGEGDEIKLAVQLNRHYPLTVLDGGPAGLPKLLKVTDQLVLVAPANVEAAGALADTRDWLDAHGHGELAMQSVTVINGVSRRSLPDVEQAEAIARGRSRAIVRVPWDDMLPVAATGPSTLRPQTRVAYTALAGVLVAGLAAAAAVRKAQ